MTDYVLEAEALADWEDDNCIVDYDDFSLPRFRELYYFPKYAGFRKKKLGKVYRTQEIGN